MPPDPNFQQPQLPRGQRCEKCGVELDHTYYGAAWWRDKWFCLTCFMQREVRRH